VLVEDVKSHVEFPVFIFEPHKQTVFNGMKMKSRPICHDVGML